MVTSDDITKSDQKKQKINPKISETAPDLIEKLLQDFDPDTIDIDRRIF